MKIQNLAVIFIVIILPISMVLTSYTHSQMKTLDLQISYDSKLDNATYDALKAFQLNTINNTASDLANSKLQDIEASVNTFFNSISSNFNMAGYNQDALKHYVPALVYTMYDGYYIYSPYTNTLTDNEIKDKDGNNRENITYKNGENIYGLKPYIHYSCRYKIDSDDTDVVITYALDNYITVQGKVKGRYFCKSGYLLDNIEGTATTTVNLDDNITYRGIPIKEENLEEFINENDKVPYVKINGQKYYKKNDGNWYSSLNGEEYSQGFSYGQNKSAKQYYLEAYKFTKWIKDNLEELKASDAYNEDGTEKLTELVDDLNADGTPKLNPDGSKKKKKVQKFEDEKIFEFGGDNAYDNNIISIEDPNSKFNQHRLAIIRYSIEKNLSIAITNYNNYAGGVAAQNVNFQMPKLKEDEWTKIINNVSIISFLQGLSIGGKIYNGYSIITNTQTQEVVNEESIYIADDNKYYKITDIKFNTRGFNAIEEYTGYLNTDFRRRTRFDKDLGINKYFFPQTQLGSYDSIVTKKEIDEANIEVTHTDEEIENIYKYVQKLSANANNVKKAYYTALGRERYSMYRTNNDVDSDEMIKAYEITK